MMAQPMLSALWRVLHEVPVGSGIEDGRTRTAKSAARSRGGASARLSELCIYGSPDPGSKSSLLLRTTAAGDFESATVTAGADSGTHRSGFLQTNQRCRRAPGWR